MIKPVSAGGFGKNILLSHGMLAFFLAIFTVILLMITAHDIGLTWDEPIYIEASESYQSWFSELIHHPGFALQDQTIQQYWNINHEHPPLDKIWSGIFWAISRNSFDDITAHRVGNMLVAGILVGLVYLLVAPTFGKVAGLGAAGALLTMPRFFFHSHLAALDVPTSATIVLACVIFWHTLDRRGFKWTVLLGVAYGFAIATKVNGFIELPLILFLWALVFRRRWYVFARLALMGVIGLVIWLVTWPWLYFDTFSRVRSYILFLTVNHYQIAQWYHGHMYLPPPWHYPFVMTLAVVPLSLTLLASIGTEQVVRDFRNQKLGWLIVAFTLFPVLLLAFRLTDAFDDERLLMPSFPFIAALAGVGFGWVIRRVQKMTAQWTRPRWANAFALILAVLVFVPQIGTASIIYPHLLSYYSVTVGTLPVAVRSGLENTYWAETYASALPYLNAHAPQNAEVWVEAHDVMLYYQSIGWLRSDLRIASLNGSEGIVKGTQGYTDSIDHADFAVIEFRESGFMKAITDWISARTPVYGISYQGVPLMQIYKR